MRKGKKGTGREEKGETEGVRKCEMGRERNREYERGWEK